jgi:hypothetical protein
MISHWFIGRTGRHLFLADGNKTLQPLLQRMVTDCHEGRFMSALQAFKQRTAYANIVYDRILCVCLVPMLQQAQVQLKLSF